jgi:CHAD domain-containing protein
MKPHDPLLKRPAVDVAVALARDDLDRWVKARKRLKKEDPDGVHDFRVALRRLRSTLRAFRPELKALVPRRTRRRLRRLAKAAGTSRNLQVGREWLLSQLETLSPSEQTGAQWLVASVAAREQDAEKMLAGRITKDFPRLKRKLRGVFHHEGPSADRSGHSKSASVVFRDTLRQWTRELEGRLRAIRTVADWDDAHAARISIKRIRYLLKPFKKEIANAAAALEQLSALQDVLGSLQDARVLAGELRSALAESAAEVALRACDELLPWSSTGDSTPEPAPPADQAGLIALAQRIGADYETTFTRLRREWLEERAAVLLFLLHELGQGRKARPWPARRAVRPRLALHRSAGTAALGRPVPKGATRPAK